MRKRRSSRMALFALLVAALGAIAVGCTVGGDDRASSQIEGLGSSLQEIRRLARDEAELELVVAPGYADKTWTGVFSRQTGCLVNTRSAANSDDMLALLRSDEYDGVSASGDVSGPLMASGDVAPVDPGLIPNYEELEEGVKNQSFNSRDGRPYGVPQGRAANLLAFRTDAVPGGTDSSSVIWTGREPYTGRISVYDDPMYIADAATYLKATRPALGIDDPYQLNEQQFAAALGLLRRQARHVGEYWRAGEVTQVASFRSGESALGISRPELVQAMVNEGVPVIAIKPQEGTTGRSDTWMVSSNAANPNCMYLWMDYVLSPGVQAQIAEALVHAPVNLAACGLATNPDHCAALRADDKTWWDDVHYWTTPTADCGDPTRGEACKTLDEWQTAWAELRG